MSNKLYNCLSHDLSCDFFNETIGIIEGEPNSYPSVLRLSGISLRSKAIYDYLTNITKSVNGTTSAYPTYGTDFNEDFDIVSNENGDAWTESNWDVYGIYFYYPRKNID